MGRHRRPEPAGEARLLRHRRLRPGLGRPAQSHRLLKPRHLTALAGLLAVACAPALRFQARITDGETGRPLERAVVTVEETGMMAATDSTGLTPAVRAAANSVLAVACPGYLPTSTFVEPPARRGDTARPAILLYPDAARTVRGRVTGAGTGFPLPGAAVTVLGTQFAAVTGPGGNYRFEGFPPGPRTVRAAREGWLADSTRILAPAGDTTEVHFSLRDTTNEGGVSGAVTDARTGAPLAGVRVRLPELGIEAGTDGAGGFSFPRVPVGEHELTAARDGYRPRSLRFRVARGWSVTVDCALEPAP